MPTEQKNVALNKATFCRVLHNFIADLLVSTRANVLFKLAANINTFFTNFHQLFFATLPKQKISAYSTEIFLYDSMMKS